MNKKITSASNPLIKHWFKLNNDRSYRHETKRCLIESHKLISEISKRIAIQAYISTHESSNSHNFHYEITENLAKKISATPHPDGHFAEIELPEVKLGNNANKILILDRIQDPKNLGALARTALSLSWDGIIILESSVDPFHPHAIRASKGAILILPIEKMNSNELKNFIENHQLPTLIADTTGKTLPQFNSMERCALILGNEGQGPSGELLKLGEKVHIPTSDKVESLNVAVAGAILMYAL